MRFSFDPVKHSGQLGIGRFITDLLSRAAEYGASDLHLEPTSNGLRIRARIYGLLSELTGLPAAMAGKVTTKLKMMASLDIGEQRRPQDGRLELALASGNRVDCRISTCPVALGEKVVLRLIADNDNLTDLNKLGFTADQLRCLEAMLTTVQGLIIVTGPTGSGKSATMYSLLARLNTSERNIITIEDPIELMLPGINQVNIHPKAGLDFATALRSFLRQDPDIIMVGEIRDLETAQIALRAAQTGHLVLTTLHTNSAEQTITRLMHMGLPAYLLADCLRCVIAQRLVRTLCSVCHGKIGNCPHCESGFNGRTGLFDLVPIDQNLQQLILDHASTVQIADYKKSQKLPTWHDMARDLVAQHITTKAEINRVLAH